MAEPYRDDTEALRTRVNALTEEIDAVRDQTRQLQQLQQKESLLEQELSGLRRELAGATSPRSLPLRLDTVRVASPCTASWDAMIGDGRVRFCSECNKHVYNLSGMTRDDAEELIRTTTQDLCVRLHRRADGRVLTSDCPVGARRTRKRKAVIAVVGSGLIAASALLKGQTCPSTRVQSEHCATKQKTPIMVVAPTTTARVAPTQTETKPPDEPQSPKRDRQGERDQVVMGLFPKPPPMKQTRQ